MINVFHGTDKKTHDAFQAWRRTHVDGFHMTERAAGAFTIHWAQDKRENDAGRGCAHQGGSSNRYRHDGGSCYTTARKVCSNSVAELRAWAVQRDYVTKSCSHCDKGDFRFPDEGDNPVPDGHPQTLAEEAALAKQVFESEFPNTLERRTVVELLLSSIKTANSVAPNAWAVTLFRNGFRLNVGQVEVLIVGHEYVGLNCVGSPTAPVSNIESRAMEYRSMPQPQCRYECKAPDLHRLSDSVLSAHRQFVELAARSPSGKPRAGTSFRKSHCEGLVKYATDFVNTDGSVLEHTRSMPAYLFLWNPRQDNASFRDFDQVCADAATGLPYETSWTCPSRNPQPGDIALLQRTGREHNGVFAIGVITRGAYEQRGVQVVGLRLDSFLPLGEELSRADIVATARYERPWMPMASGNIVPEPLLEAILKLWKRPSVPPADEESAGDPAALAEELEALEGEQRQQMVRHRKREAALRAAKVAAALSRHGRLACEVPGCGFDFAQTYGSVGAAYAHVHHLQPLASRERPQQTRLSDLAIVCANCHAMIHRNGGCRDMASLLA